MATRPSAYPQWTQGLSTQITQPPTDIWQQGYTPSQSPIPDYDNWLLYTINEWIEWFDQQVYSPNTVATITGNTTGAQPVTTYFCNVTSAGFNFTFPASASNAGYKVTLKNASFGSSNVVNLLPTGSDTLEGASSDTLVAGDSKTYQADGNGNWFLVGAE